MAVYDHYKAADEIIRMLRDKGLNDWAEKLDNAIAAGYTGTEIAMALCWNLMQMKRKEKKLSSDVLNKTNKLITELKKILPDVSFDE
jgi:sugar phosphate isomerase/epimerase